MNGNQTGLAPESGPDPVVLILGSFPSQRSMASGEYYANPRNQFWQVMNLLFDIDPALPYQERIARIRESRIALWDAIRSCRRQGSLDSAIRDVVLNDIPRFLEIHPEIRFIGANGTAAGRYLASGLRAGPELPGVRVCLLPSTSPANTRYTIGEKMEKWKTILEYTW